MGAWVGRWVGRVGRVGRVGNNKKGTNYLKSVPYLVCLVVYAYGSFVPCVFLMWAIIMVSIYFLGLTPWSNARYWHVRLTSSGRSMVVRIRVVILPMSITYSAYTITTYINLNKVCTKIR